VVFAAVNVNVSLFVGEDVVVVVVVVIVVGEGVVAVVLGPGVVLNRVVGRQSRSRMKSETPNRTRPVVRELLLTFRTQATGEGTHLNCHPVFSCETDLHLCPAIENFAVSCVFASVATFCRKQYVFSSSHISAY